MTVTDYLDDDDEATAPEQPTMELHDAVNRLDVAVSQLVMPGLEYLDRSRPEADAAVKAVDDEHAAQAQEFRAQHALAHHRRDGAGMRRALERLILHAQRAQARAVTAAPLPSLLEQLRDAVSGTSGTNGAPGAGAYRSAIGLAAAEFLGHIERTVWARPGDDLAAKVREWAEAITAEQNATTLPAAAVWAEQCVKRARAILAPDRGKEIPEPCPRCGNRYAYVLDDSGQRVRKSALFVGHADQIARCLVPACGERWPKDKWEFLNRQIEHGRKERERPVVLAAVRDRTGKTISEEQADHVIAMILVDRPGRPVRDRIGRLIDVIARDDNPARFCEPPERRPEREQAQERAG